MVKAKIKIKRKKSIDEVVEEVPTFNEKDKQLVRDVVANASLTRANLMNKLFDPRRDIDDECGYPKEISTAQFKTMYDREGLATRVVSLYPEESWAEDPAIVEDDDTKDTEFEEAWKELDRERQLFSYMARIDELSGIGRYGILLLGFDDGKELNLTVKGINKKGEKIGNPKHKLLYLRALDESCVNIKSIEKDKLNPRYGKPTMYSISFKDTNSTGETKTGTGKEQNVHWTRVIHIADNRKSSELYGVPRIQTLYNRLYDLRKITGGSAEMFWKGGFPGYSFEMDPNATVPAAGSIEETAMKKQIEDYSNGLQRYLTTQGITVNSLDPQVADPKAHVDIQLEMIAIAMGVPKRIFMGSEQAKLASVQDSEHWNKRIKKREKKYLTPYVVRPTIDRLITVGVLPEPVQYEVEWPDLNAPSDKDKAEVLKLLVEAFAKYMGGDVDMLIPPEIFFKMFMGLDEDEIKEITKQAQDRQDEFQEEQDELNKEDDEENEDE